MSNSLTGLDNNYLNREYSNISNIQKKSENNTNEFEGMLKEKINRNGSVDEKKLSPKEKKLYDSCVEMESLMWKQVLGSMKQTINKFSLLDGGQAEDIFSDFLYEEYSKMMAKNGGANLTNTIYKQISRYE